ncbi:MAG: universal stress protein [Chloroflexi bacterium]|nr:universal stress protein [Chloroflexota bacterium]
MLYTKILVPFDGSQGSWKAMRKAILLAREQRAELAALSVEEKLPHYAATVGEVQEEEERQKVYFTDLQAQAAALAREQGIDLSTEVLAGHAAGHIVHYAREHGFDLIVIGQSGHSGIWGTLLGSTTARVVSQAHCDVLVVR